MAIRMTGLNSGIDTDSIVAALMSAQRTKMTKVEDKKQRLEWKKEKWAAMNTKIYNFYKGSLSNMRFSKNYTTKAASSSNTTKITAKASTTAATGTYAVKVNSLAAAQYVTSGKLREIPNADNSGTEKITDSTKLTSLLNSSGNHSFSVGSQVNIKCGSKEVTLNVAEDTTVADFTNKCAEAGLNATFDENQQRFFISSKKSGEENKFEISSSQMDSGFVSGVTNAIKYSALSNSDKMNYLDATNVIVSGATGDARTAAENKIKELAKTAAENDASNRVNKFYLEVAKHDTASNLTAEEETAINEQYASVADLTERATKIQQAKDAKKLEKAQGLLATEAYQNNIASALTNGLSNGSAVAGVSVTAEYEFESAANRLTHAEAAAASVISQCASGVGVISSNDNVLSALGLGRVTGAAVPGNSGDDSQMVVKEASDSEIVFNGATLRSTDTNMKVAGVELNLLGVTDDEVNITVTNDTDGVYDTIKEFISEYNSILKEMNTSYKAASSKGFQVLTDEQKEAMSDKEVEQWENKIKDSLLRRDDTLSGIISSFRNNMMGYYKDSNNSTYALSSIGIVTSGDYAEGGLLHIKGDEDDQEYSGEKNTLKKMLEEDPDKVMNILTTMAGKLYDDLGKKMQRTNMSSALTFYNDKEMASQLSDYKKSIANWEDKLTKMEDKYYSQFTAMEKAMASLNSKQNTLANYLG